MDTNRKPDDGTHTSFWQAHSKCILIAAAVVLAAAAAALFFGRTPKDKAVDHITAFYSGDTKAGTVLDENNPPNPTDFTFTVTPADEATATASPYFLASPKAFFAHWPVIM